MVPGHCRYLRNRADFAVEAAYTRWPGSEAEHPVSRRRTKSLAAAMQRQAHRGAGGNEADVLAFIASRLDAIGVIVEDPQMQRYVRRCAPVGWPADLQRLEDRPCL